MKKLLTVLLLLVSTSSFAHPYGYYGYGHGYRGGWDAPAIIGGAALGYAITMPMYQQPYNNYYYQPPQPVYQYQWVYDQYCNCQRQIQVRVQ